jgi:hypothetical protein
VKPSESLYSAYHESNSLFGLHSYTRSRNEGSMNKAKPIQAYISPTKQRPPTPVLQQTCHLQSPRPTGTQTSTSSIKMHTLALLPLLLATAATADQLHVQHDIIASMAILQGLDVCRPGQILACCFKSRGPNVDQGDGLLSGVLIGTGRDGIISGCAALDPDCKYQWPGQSTGAHDAQRRISQPATLRLLVNSAVALWLAVNRPAAM